jgi:hypothetical protein
LLTLADFPSDYGSIPSSIAGTLGEFNAAVPSSLSYNSVEYYYPWTPSSSADSDYIGLGVSEMLGEAPSAQAAQTMAENLNSVNNRCNPGTPLDLPGTEPNVIVCESLGVTYSSAIAYATKRPYVVQLTWVDELGETSAGPTTLPTGTLPTGDVAQLPAATEMASIANAALAHLPA